jgi:mRNA interferase MazF
MSNAELVQGDIVLIPHYPHTDYLGSKPRPALIISTSDFNTSTDDVVLVAFSSQTLQDPKYSVTVSSSDACFLQTGLKVSSTIRCNKIFAMDKTRLGRRLGHLPDALCGEVKKILSRMFAINAACSVTGSEAKDY